MVGLQQGFFIILPQQLDVFIRVTQALGASKVVPALRDESNHSALSISLEWDLDVRGENMWEILTSQFSASSW